MKSSSLPKSVGLFLVLSFLALPNLLQASTQYYFYVQLKDKNSTVYSLSNPSEFLSARSIQRRMDFNLALDSTDLPVNQSYVQTLQNLGVTVHSRTKWMNGITVLVTDSNLMQTVRGLDFVKFASYTGKLETPNPVVAKRTKMNTTFDYGTASNQMNQLNAKFLHDSGYRGQGIHIAVIDAGFKNVNVNPCFDSLRIHGNLLGTHDVISASSNIFAEDEHGANVLSTMAANLHGQYLGSAPDASYWLIRTEYVPTEYRVEVDFWVRGIEFADSVGADVVNSSLGYTVFDDNSMNFSYADMNGEVSRASRAATLASSKGILVLNSAGNEGDKSWKYISSPADASGIITVGGVTETGLPSVFSSFGPTADGRIKPDACARGTAAALVLPSGILSAGSGTSFASPILTGVSACLLQAYKAQSAVLDLNVLRQAIIESGSSYLSPTAQMGYGIPDFQLAMQALGLQSGIEQVNMNEFLLNINGENKTIHVHSLESISNGQPMLRIYSITGKLLMEKMLEKTEELIDFKNYPAGIYVIHVAGKKGVAVKKFIVR